MDKCPGCKCSVRWYQPKGGNTSWHKRCWDSWHEGYETARKFSDEMSARFYLPTASEIYWATQINSPAEKVIRVIGKIKLAMGKLTGRE